MIEAADIALRRAALETEAVLMHRARGTAELEGKRFDGKRLAGIEAELASLEDAETVERERAQTTEAARASETRHALQAAIAGQETARLDALAAAEAAAATLVEALATFLDSSGKIARASAELKAGVPITLERTDIETRLSNLIVGALSPIRTSAQRFGVLEWFVEQPPTRDWPAAERRVTGRAIARLCNDQEITR